MKEIDLDHWKRRAHFEFFRRSDLPFYNVNTMVDISGVREFSKAQSLSVNSTLMFASIRALNTIENFRYRLRDQKVVLHEGLHPSFAYLGPQEDLFRLITLNFIDDLGRFHGAVRQAIEESSEYFNLDKLRGRDDFVFFSSLPWIAFTGVDHPLSLKKDDAIPRITWGRFTPDGNRTLLPFNIQVNHMFVDGLHVGRFFEELDRQLATLVLSAG